MLGFAISKCKNHCLLTILIISNKDVNIHKSKAQEKKFWQNNINKYIEKQQKENSAYINTKKRDLLTFND